MAVSPERMRKALITAGVKNVRAYGYPKANENNILTDTIYSQLFKGMLEDESNVGKQADIEKARLALLAEIPSLPE